MSPPFDASFHADGIGGSDVAAIVGLSKFKTAWHVWLEKTGQGEPQAETEAMELGTALEPVILQTYAKRQGVTLLPGRSVSDPERPWRRAQIDGEVAGQPVGVEAKTAGLIGYLKAGVWGDEGTDQIPQYYLAQCHWQLLLMPKWEVVHVPALIAGRGLCTFCVERNADFEDWIAAAVDQFWQRHVVARVPPAIDASDLCARYLARIHPPKQVAEWLESTPAIDELAFGLQRARDQRKASEEAEELAKNRLRSLIGDARGVRGKWGLATWGANGKGGRRLTLKWSNEGEEEAA